MGALRAHAPGDTAMEALRQRFILRLADTIERLDSCAEAMVRGVAVKQNAGVIVGELHRISGLAGSFGFGDLGAEAGELEMALDGWLKDPEGTKLSDLLFDLETHVACLDEVVQESAA